MEHVVIEVSVVEFVLLAMSSLLAFATSGILIVLLWRRVGALESELRGLRNVEQKAKTRRMESAA
ncbi:MAG: hypothetical protein ACK5XN_20880, partial [Bacteroidota bacterium]